EIFNPRYGGWAVWAVRGSRKCLGHSYGRGHPSVRYRLSGGSHLPVSPAVEGSASAPRSAILRSIGSSTIDQSRTGVLECTCNRTCTAPDFLDSVVAFGFTTLAALRVCATIPSHRKRDFVESPVPRGSPHPSNVMYSHCCLCR